MLVLVDTSVWVQHFRRTVPELITRLAAGEVLAHSPTSGLVLPSASKSNACEGSYTGDGEPSGFRSRPGAH